MQNIYTAFDENGAHYEFDVQEKNGHFYLTLPMEKFLHAQKIYALGEFTEMKAGDEGYYILPRHRKQTGEPQIFFRERPDATQIQYSTMLSYCGFKTKEETYLIRVDRNYDFFVRAQVQDCVYHMEILFDFTERKACDCSSDAVYDDIRIEIVPLGADADYNTMAKAEREIRIEREGIKTLRERCAARPAVDYARKHPLVRIRNGWKPAPPQVLHQTPENEPPMHVACTFERVRQLADECKRQGLEGVELQLVGWNKHGHDGAWPDKFPADEQLGGNEGLKQTIDYVKSLGYRISTHDNIMDSYEIGERFNWDDLAVIRNGEHFHHGSFSGGMTYRICPQKFRHYIDLDLPKLKEYGENGLHYSDVFSIITPYPCYSQDHPVSRKEAIRITQECMQYESEAYGGFSSEGGMDFAMGQVDYVLYVSFGGGFGVLDEPLCDAYLPVWELTYHGLVLYNPASPTVNYTIKEPQDRLTAIMRGGKPTFYIYSKFRTGAANWMGENDLTCDTDADMQATVADICRGERDFAPLADRQFLLMTRYEYPAEGLECATYEDGSRMVGNFTDQPVEFEGRTIEPYQYSIFEA